MIRTALLSTGPAERPLRQPGEEATLEQASRRLHAAIDALEGAIDRRLEDDHQRVNLEVELQNYDSDRSRLAGELDRLRVRSTDLEAANREVSRRLDHAVETIRAVLAAHER
jgi:hypothetical protein